MADELRIVARYDDQGVGKGLEKLRGELAATSRVPGLDDLRKRFGDIESTITRLRQTGAQFNAAGGIGGMLGLGGLTGIASVAGLAASMRDLARSQVEMRHFSRETGIAAGHLRELQALGQKFQIAPDATTGALSGFASELDLIRKRRGAAYGELSTKAPGLAKQLQESTDNFDAFDKALDFLSKIENVQDQKRWANILGLGEMNRLFTDGPKALRDAWKEVQASGIGKPNPELEKQSKALVDALNRFDTSVETMKRTWGPTLLGEMANAVERLSGAFGKFADAYEKFRSGRPIDALKTIDEATDLGVGQRKNAPPSTPATPLDEQLDAQMRGQAPQSQAEKDRAGRIADAEARLRKAQEDLGYQQRRFPLKDEGAIKVLSEEVRKLIEELRRLREDGATKQNMSFEGGGGGGLGGLIHRASLRFPGSGGGYGGGGGGFGPGGSYGAGSRAFDQLRGGSGGSSGSGGAGGAAVGPGANPGAYKDVLDFIARAEGTAGQPGGGYNTSLGYGKYLPGGKEQNLTSMTLDQISALGRHMRRQPGNPNSSALGRYQIVGDTMRRLMGRMGLKGDELFDERMQDRMASELARDTRGDPGRLRNEWASLVGERNRRAVELMRQVGSGGSSVAGDASGLRLKSREATAGGESARGLTDLLKQLQDDGLPGGFDRVTALNDAYHRRVNPGSKHTSGLAGDVTIRDARRSAQAAEAIRERLRAAGLDDRSFKVLDEYKNPSAHATGGHLHVQFNNPDAAERYRAFADAQRERERQIARPRHDGGERHGDAGMLARARRAGVMGAGGAVGAGALGRIDGTIELKGFPPGTKSDFTGGGVVKAVKLNKGSTMHVSEA